MAILELLENRSFVGVLAPLAAILSVGCGASPVGAAEIDRIATALELRPGARVADVGAGAGQWAVELARIVGEDGHVWATEVDADEIESIEDEVLGAFLDNVTVVLGDQTRSGLPAECCDAILLRMVYHHFVEPAKMRADLRRALRPGGLIAVVDVTPQTGWRRLPDVPDRGGHGIEPAELIEEMTSAGFELVSRRDDWDGDEDRYCIVFRR